MMSRSVTGSNIGLMSDQLRVSLYMIILQNVLYHSREGYLISCDKIPLKNNELPQRRFQAFVDISLPEKLIGKSHRTQNQKP